MKPVSRLLFITAFAVAAGAWARASAAPRRTVPRTLRFSGYEWRVKSSVGPVGPGPNLFSDRSENVWVDSKGRLHLRITRTKDGWQCAEIISRKSFGYGTYRFEIAGSVGALDPQVVLGLFTWSDDPAFHHREIDIEFSRWGKADDPNSQYVVQPYTRPENIRRFLMPPVSGTSTHSFTWRRYHIRFRSVRGTAAGPPEPGTLIQQADFTRNLPEAGGENARINLWLMRGSAPTDGQPVEVIIARFRFIPLSGRAKQPAVPAKTLPPPRGQAKRAERPDG